jgi:hypothetical protein
MHLLELLIVRLLLFFHLTDGRITVDHVRRSRRFGRGSTGAGAHIRRVGRIFHWQVTLMAHLPGRAGRIATIDVRPAPVRPGRISVHRQDTRSAGPSRAGMSISAMGSAAWMQT